MTRLDPKFEEQYRAFFNMTGEEIFNLLQEYYDTSANNLFELSFSYICMGIIFYFSFLHKWLQNSPEISRVKDDTEFFIPIVVIFVPYFISFVEYFIDNIHTILNKHNIWWMLSLLVPINFIEWNMYYQNEIYRNKNMVIIPVLDWNSEISPITACAFVLA